MAAQRPQQLHPVDKQVLVKGQLGLYEAEIFFEGSAPIQLTFPQAEPKGSIYTLVTDQ